MLADSGGESKYVLSIWSQGYTWLLLQGLLSSVLSHYQEGTQTSMHFRWAYQFDFTSWLCWHHILTFRCSNASHIRLQETQIFQTYVPKNGQNN